MTDNDASYNKPESLLKSIFFPPRFEDEEKTRIARILTIITWAIIVVVIGLMLTWLIRGSSEHLGAYAYLANGFIIVMALGILILIRRSYVQAASLVFLCMLWGNITFQALTSDGVRGSVSLVYMLILILSSLLIGWKASIIFSGISVLSIWILAHLERINLMIFQIDEPYQVALETTAIFIVAGIVFILTSTGLNRALLRARTSEKSLNESNLALLVKLKELAERENDLKQSEEQFRLLAENVVDIIWIVNPEDLKIIYASPSVQRIAGYTPDEIKGLSLETLLTEQSHVTAMNAFETHLSRFKDDPSQSITIELEMIHKDGSNTWIETTARVLYINWLSTHGIIGVTRDISDRKEAEQEKKNLQNQLLRAQKMEAVGTLAGGIAHDFNNSLQGILGYAQMLLWDKQEGDADFQKLIQIKGAAERASDLTKQLLMFSRDVESQLRPLDLNQEIHHLETLFERTLPKMISTDIVLAQALHVINGDAAQIEQVLMNLIINARDAMPSGGRLVIETSNITLDDDNDDQYMDAEPGEYVLLRVADSGEGMSSDTLEHIFEPFYTTKERGQGTGLGLSMVYGIVQNHGGHISCISSKGRGTTFNILFPTVVESSGETREIEEEQKDIPRGDETVLFVDDEDFIRDLGRELLSDYGYTVLTAPDGESAIKLYEEKSDEIDLIILDLIMPGLGGWNCLKQLIDTDPSVKVVISSGYSVQGQAKEALEMGAKAYVSKPFDLKQIPLTVRRVLDGEPV